ncbi:hypothetical protein SAMN04488120_104232 [Fontimonas thermophila]|uniref:Ig-like domain (Group 2) n=1 Tax=Fontimonas thermophila TaxID=1076937 RepID=A0A1I2IWF8_9GAMM|nr:hypothetical protein [Fontimonas thermophila]SFF45337.1 hypothetical protein SAMN04488120_104232 [Fontimonas thermophila]
MFRLIPSLRIAVLFATAAVLSACDIGGIGDGNRLESLQIARLTALIDRDRNDSYVCFTDKLQLIGTFTNGGRGDYSSRARWASSDPSIVAVSNGDILIPGSQTLAYAPGTIIPKAQGTATITAEFVGLSASYEVTVKTIEPSAIEISAERIVLAPETVRGLSLTAHVDGYELDVTQAATWSFVDANDQTDDIATINATTGTVVARLPPTLPVTLRARAEFPECQDETHTAPRRYEADVVIDNPESLTLEREFADGAPLIVNTSEAYKVTANFSGGETQDLTGQAKLESSDSATIAPTVFSIVSALKAGSSVMLKAVYGGPSAEGDEAFPPRVESNVISLDAVEGVLQGFTIAPLNETITALGRQQFTALGRFMSGDALIEQPITRHVIWAVRALDDAATSAVSISNLLASKGLAVSLQPRTDAVKVRATFDLPNTTEDLVEETVLCIAKPDDAAGSCPPDDMP